MRKNINKIKFLIYLFIPAIFFSNFPVAAYAEERLTITTYYPSPSGSYLDLNVARNLTLESVPLAADGPQIQWRTNSSRHWNIDQLNNRLRFYTEDINDLNGEERLEITDDNMMFIGNPGNGNFIFRAPDDAINDAGDIIFQRGNSPSYSQKGRIWSESGSSASGLFLSSGNNTPDITITSNGFVGIGPNIGENPNFTILGADPTPLLFLPRISFNNDVVIHGEIDATGGFGPVLTARLIGGIFGFTTALWTTVPSSWMVTGPLAYGIGLSSIRFKEKVKPITNALSNLQRLQGVTFVWKGSDKRDLGLIAEEVGKVFPELLTYDSDGETIEGFNYSGLIAVLVEGVKEQQKEIEELKSRVRALEKK